MRMNMRRFTRLTNAFSKKVENLEAAMALHYMHSNFCRLRHVARYPGDGNGRSRTPLES